MRALDVSNEKVGETAVVHVAGELDLATVGELHKTTKRALTNCADLIIDLSACTFIDSTGLGSILRLAEEAKIAGGAVALTGVGGQARRVFDLTRSSDYVRTFDSVPEAVMAFSGRESRSVVSELPAG